MRLVHGLSFDNIRGDIYGGLTAAVVALPFLGRFMPSFWRPLCSAWAVLPNTFPMPSQNTSGDFWITESVLTS